MNTVDIDPKTASISDFQKYFEAGTYTGPTKVEILSIQKPSEHSILVVYRSTPVIKSVYCSTEIRVHCFRTDGGQNWDMIAAQKVS